MKISDQHLNHQLALAQKLLWGGSETENIAAHNLIVKLMIDLGVDELEDDMIPLSFEEEYP